MARGLCRVRFFPLRDVPRSARRSALLVQIQAWAPFAESSFAVVLRDQGALVFAWDRALFLRRAEAAGLPMEGVMVLPETLLLPRGEAGVTLHPCEVGCVAEYWQAGDLLQSRWWPEWPDAEAWLNFQRGVGVPGDAQQPRPPHPSALVDWLDRPWAWPLALDALRGLGRLWEHAAMGALILLLLAPTFWLARTWHETDAALARANLRKDQMENQVKPILAAREQAEAAIGAAQAMAARIDRPDALALLLHLSRLLPQDGSTVRELEWQGQRLHVSLATPPGAPRGRYIKALESGRWLRDVREAPESMPGGFALDAAIEGSLPPPAAMGEGVTPPLAPEGAMETPR